MIKNYTITLTTFSPVFIGDGIQISKKDCLYLSNERKVYIMDNMKLFNGIRKAGLLKQYENFLMDSSQRNFSVFTRNNSIPLNDVKKWAAYTLPMNDITDINNSRKNGGGSDNILSFIKDKFGCPYIPGSSLKGALRTVIQNAVCIEGNKDSMAGIRKNIETEVFEKRPKYLLSTEKKLSENLFHTLNRKEEKKSDMLNDAFAGFRVSDSLPLDVSSLILCQKIDRHPDGRDISLPIKRECIKPGTKIEFQLEIDTDMMDISADEIIRYVQVVFDEYEETFLDEFNDDNIVYCDCNAPIVIGGGTGYVSKTSVYSLYKEKSDAVKAVQKIMIDTTSTKKQRDPHKHYEDTKIHRISPHIRKLTRYDGILYDMGICNIEIKAVK
ncbi:MAG: type III-A CRISPR-associated RAMP protein Csm5 [Oscillospiraceae bacterium]|nr:type III-A CRISPR-associated RAMP protein Csm5 [Oscillospiraceae bacterium]